MLKTQEIIKAVTTLRAGGLVAFPTETVYGLGADATNPDAIQKVFAAKGRPHDHPLIVHLHALSELSTWAQAISPAAMKLAEACWPGPLTLILKKQPHVLDLITAGQQTVGVRMPKHPVALALLQAFGGGVVAPSANKFTHLSPTLAMDVQEELGNAVDVILDGGACEVGVESTIVDMSGDTPAILRPGMISAERISEILSVPIEVRSAKHSTVKAPGMHVLHYAPLTKTRRANKEELATWLASLQPSDLPIAVVTHSGISIPASSSIHVVTMPIDPAAYAHDLYHTLRVLDHQQFKQIIIEEVPAGSQWEAIRDRISKATVAR